jgi:glycosyltransferase involved in cell wall biosynthesis
LERIPGIVDHMTMDTRPAPAYTRLLVMNVNVSNFMKWLNVLSAFKPDYVHATQDYGLQPISLACFLKGVPLIISAHSDTQAIATRDVNFSFLGNNIFGRIHTQACIWFAKLGWCTWSLGKARYLPVSEQAKIMIRSGLGPQNQINEEIWGPMVDRKVFIIDMPADEVKETRDRLTFGIPNAFLLVYAGRVCAEKDVEFLVEALERAPKNVVLALVGNGQLAARLSKGHGKESRLHCTGDFVGRKEVALAMRAADVCASASTMETVGFTAMEALSCGTPMLAANAQGFAEHLTHNVNARLFTPYDKANFDEDLAFLMNVAAKGEGCWSREELRKSMDGASLTACTERALRCYSLATKKPNWWYLRMLGLTAAFMFQVTVNPFVY